MYHENRIYTALWLFLQCFFIWKNRSFICFWKGSFSFSIKKVMHEYVLIIKQSNTAEVYRMINKSLPSLPLPNLPLPQLSPLKSCFVFWFLGFFGFKPLLPWFMVVSLQQMAFCKPQVNAKIQTIRNHWKWTSLWSAIPENARRNCDRVTEYRSG